MALKSVSRVSVQVSTLETAPEKTAHALDTGKAPILLDRTYLQGLPGSTGLPPNALPPTAVSLLRKFFELLDQWDRGLDQDVVR